VCPKSVDITISSQKSGQPKKISNRASNQNRAMLQIAITDHIKRLISNGYPNNACFNKGIRTKPTYHILKINFSFPYKPLIPRHNRKTIFLDFKINEAFHKPIISPSVL
jgi:hypothetical protein